MRDPEFLALVSLINPRAPPTHVELERRMGPGGVFCGWPALLDYAERHRVVPLFANRLRDLGWMEESAFPVDADLRAKLERTIREAAFAELASLGEIKRISGRFGEHGVTPILLKGLALSSLCFGKIGWRTNHDIDLLVEPGAVLLCDRLLAEMDYVRIEPDPALDAIGIEQWRRWHKDWVYIHRTRRTIVELHYRLFDNPRLCEAIGEGAVEPLDLFGQHEALTLAGEYLRSYLALHGLLHGWSRLKWLIDYELLRAPGTSPASTSIAIGVAERLCELLFAPSPSPVKAAGHGRTAWLVRASLRAMADGGVQELERTRFGTTIKNISHYLISLHPAYWVAELRYDLADMSREDLRGEPGRSGFLKRIGGWIFRKLRAESNSPR